MQGSLLADCRECHEFVVASPFVHIDALLVICTRLYEADHITCWLVYASECERGGSVR